MFILKLILLTVAIYSLTSIVVAFAGIAVTLKNKGKANAGGSYFPFMTFLLSVSVAALVLIW
jgi:hypothetical protein